MGSLDWNVTQNLFILLPLAQMPEDIMQVFVEKRGLFGIAFQSNIFALQ